MKSRYLFLAALTTTIFQTSSAQVNPAPISVVTAGDSMTRQTGQCDELTLWDQCWDSVKTFPSGTVVTRGSLINSATYASYLNPATLYTVTTSDVSGRGGDTCADFSGAPYYKKYGPIFNYQPITGLLVQVDSRVLNRNGSVVSLLIGANDIAYRSQVCGLGNICGKPETKTCIASLIRAISFGQSGFAGKKLVVMKYPKYPGSASVPNTNNPWGSSDGYRYIEVANEAISEAVAEFNNANPSRKVTLVDASSIILQGSLVSLDTKYHPSADAAWLISRLWAKQVCGPDGAGPFLDCRSK